MATSKTAKSGAMACANCRFWNRIESAVGECRHQSPRTLTTIEVDQKVIANKGVWPRTFEHEWCGDFAKRGTDALP